MAQPTRHGTALVVGETGFLVVGPSGAGKTSLALSLTTQAAARGLFAAIIADDRVLLSQNGGRVIAEAPPPLQGLVELTGVGVVPVPICRRAVIHAVLALAPGDAPRDFDAALADETGLPVFGFGARRCSAATAAVFTLIGEGRFGLALPGEPG